MDSSTTFRRLAMISFLHRYFLDTEENFFSLSAVQQATRLQTVISRNQYPLMNDLVVEPTDETKKNIAAHKIIFKILPQGILLGAPIVPTKVNGNVKYRPLISLSRKLRLQFTIKKRNGFDSYTSTRIGPVLPAAYYFTNDDPTNDKVFPSLAAAAKNSEQTRLYEMGETAIINGKVRQCIRTTTDAVSNNWKVIPADQYISEYDRILTGKRFTYNFEKTGVKKATFTLRTSNQVIKEISAENAIGLTSVDLDWQNKDDDTPIPDGHYHLSVSGDNNSYKWSGDVYLNSTVTTQRIWGLLDIAVQTGNTKFSLIDKDGFLPDDPMKYPNLELRFLSRSTYWKYYFQKKSPSTSDQNWTDLTPPPGISKLIISKEPILLKKNYQKIKYSNDLLPNPSNYYLSKVDDKICSEILLTTIKL